MTQEQCLALIELAKGHLLAGRQEQAIRVLKDINVDQQHNLALEVEMLTKIAQSKVALYSWRINRLEGKQLLEAAEAATKDGFETFGLLGFKKFVYLYPWREDIEEKIKVLEAQTKRR